MCEDFWRRVKMLIKQNNTKQEWLAEKTGIKYQTLRSMISKNTFPKADDAVRMAKSLGTTAEYLVNGYDKTESEMQRFYAENARFSVFLEYLAKLTSNQIEDLEAMVIALAQKNIDKESARGKAENPH